MKDYGKDLFRGTAVYYAAYRPVYPETLLHLLHDRFFLDGSQTVIDLGCGPGDLALRLADHCREVIGVDQEQEMLDVARMLQRKKRKENVSWVHGTVEEYLNQFHRMNVVTIAKAFHWMDRAGTLDSLYEFVVPGGGVAVIDDYEPDKAATEWQETFNEVVRRWYGPTRRAGNTTYSHPEITHEQIIEQSAFDLEVYELPEVTIRWDIPSIIGNHYSTSFGKKQYLGEDAPLFEEEVKAALGSCGMYEERRRVSVKIARKQGKRGSR
ncbi:UNVERIFIED_CONTAM: class I SAM-dependent methyltransferase [Halobacillus marinus]